MTTKYKSIAKLYLLVIILLNFRQVLCYVSEQSGLKEPFSAVNNDALMVD